MARMYAACSRAMFAIVMAVVLIVPIWAAVAQDGGVRPNSTCVPAKGVTLSGPTDVITVRHFGYTATIGPPEATPPFQVRWQVTDNSDLFNAGVPSPLDVQEFAWTTPGIKTVRVIVMNACNPAGTSAEYQVRVGPLPMSDVPADAYRRAAHLLEEQRGSGQSPEWANARLSDRAMPLYRPDMTEPAYYEFTVVSPPGSYGVGAAIGDEPAGYIIVSTGEHDYPITNWRTTGLAPTARMWQEPLSGHQVPVKFYKLDVLSYAAENAMGELVATDGDMPPRITGYPADWRERPAAVAEMVWAPKPFISNDPVSGEDEFDVNLTISGTLDIPLQFESWASWEQLKAGYAETYEPLTEVLRENAGDAWSIETAAREHGYTLFKGESITVPLLWREADIHYSGPALSLVDITLNTPDGLPHTLAITAVDAIPGQAVTMTIDIDYAHGAHESVAVLVAHDWKLSLPVVFAGLGEGPTPAGTAAQGHVASVSPQSASGTVGSDGFTYWYVGGTKAAADAQQCWYRQFPKSDPVNTSDCHSGCGPAAWAMLICWGDNQAAAGTNTAWAGRWGLYRVNGGRGNDYVAPKVWDHVVQGTGVKNMTWEINRAVDTWCNMFNDNGATWPGDMINVSRYLNGRSGVQVRTWSWGPGTSESSLTSYARNVIQNEGDWARPTVIGTGFYSHYALAYGYRQKVGAMCTNHCDWQGCKKTCLPMLLKSFYVNQGWGGTSGEWVGTDLFFTGRMTPHQSYMDDVALYRSSNRSWYFDFGHDGTLDRTHSPFGWPNDVRPVVGDFDRDGVLDDVAVFLYTHADTNTRYSWRFDYDNNRTTDLTLGAWTFRANGFPVALDHDRDGYVDDLGVYFPAERTWRFNIDHNSVGHSDASLDWPPASSGMSLYGRPVAGDFDCDGYVDDLALFDSLTGMWYFDFDRNGTTDRIVGPWGSGMDIPIVGDFDKDGCMDDAALFSSADRLWRYKYNMANLPGGVPVVTDKTRGPFGAQGDLPVAGNFDTQ